MTEYQIVYEDNHLLVINKQVGQLVQGDKTGDKSLLDEIKDFIKIRDHKPGNVFLGLVHRIDRPTSGLVIYAKTSKALSRLTQMVKNREIEKTYWAIVPKEMIPLEQKLVHYLRKNEKNNKATVFEKVTEGAKEARLHYKVIRTLDNYYLLEIDLETGRHHQIRAQLAKIGIPIKGDLKYGAPRSNPDGGIHLHARKLSFIHPVTKEAIEIIAPTNPQDKIWQACEK
ncbi:RNA pseudouridine synthase [Elizabethkingia anophelis]|uniref:RluA family pseudouridine synthase n=1 Tax=Elizabethkingia anophelis TaxID=1117645 RepID=UPI0021A609E5|nr:RNA pseudouridine synthase [Elizabethkingia anophelis]MCT3872883.1 RNA pseudouridine synthase [Elizabethkingia anophelis]MDV3846818.1 RNA pseudouridine synthase [Elizabethkingia anophelis]